MYSFCVVCGGELNSVPIDYPHPDSGKSELTFKQIEICAECGFGMALPRYNQDELDSFYSSGAYWSDVVKENPFQNAHEKNQARLRVMQSVPYIHGNGVINVLDIGAGHAHTMTWLEKLFPEKLKRFDFIEHDEDKCRGILKGKHSFDVNRLGDLEQKVGYDLVFMNHVLEHVADPEYFLSGVVKQLNRGGVIYVEVPHSDYRYKCDVFPHTLFFTKESFSQLANKLGVNQLHCETFGNDVRASKKLFRKVYMKMLSQLFYLCVRLKCDRAQQWVDQRLWQYHRKGEDRVWLRWIITTTSS